MKVADVVKFHKQIERVRLKMRETLDGRTLGAMRNGREVFTRAAAIEAADLLGMASDRLKAISNHRKRKEESTAN